MMLLLKLLVLATDIRRRLSFVVNGCYGSSHCEHCWGCFSFCDDASNCATKTSAVRPRDRTTSLPTEQSQSLFKQMPLQNEQQHYRIPTINIKNRRLLQYTAAVLVDRNTICCLFLTGRYDYSAIFNAQGGDAVVV